MKKMMILTLLLDGKIYCIPEDFADGGNSSYQNQFLPLQSSNDKSYESKFDKIKEITFNHNDVINHLKVINHLNVQGIFDPAEFSVHSTLQNIQTVLES